MMREVFFFVKCMVLTVILIFLMQIKIGENTIEQRAMFWVEDSPLVEPLREVSEGGVKAVREGWKRVVNYVDNVVTSRFKKENMPGNRDIGIRLERSKQALEKNAGPVAENLKESVRRFGHDVKENASRVTEDMRDAWNPPAKEKTDINYIKEEPEWGR